MEIKRILIFLLLLFSFLFLTLIFIAGCGRKGDPIPIIPPREKAAEKEFRLSACGE